MAEGTLTTDRIPTTAHDLPDDLADCCRAALKVMGDDFDDVQELLRDLLHVVFSALLDDSVVSASAA